MSDVGDAPSNRYDIALRGELSANVVGFGRLLRDRGAGISAGEEGEALSALAHIDLSEVEAFFYALRTSLAKSQREQRLFDDCFASYWDVWNRALDLATEPPRESQEQAAVSDDDDDPLPPTATLSVSEWLNNQGQTRDEEEVAGYSPIVVESRRNFADVTDGDLEVIERLIVALARALARKLSRRMRPAGRRGRLDFRRTIRRNLRRGGELVDLSYLRRRERRVKLVLLCDVSRSMDLYSRFLVRFIYALQNLYRSVETFAFSTSLQPVSEALADRSFEEALVELASRVPGWSGGTRIGACLGSFAADYGDALLDKRTVVLILSDGWDTGEVEPLEQSLYEIRRRCSAIVWLNPLMGNPDFRPETRAMKVALPYIDLLAPAHNIDALRDLVTRLARWRGIGRTFGSVPDVDEEARGPSSAAEVSGQGRETPSAPVLASTAANFMDLAKRRSADKS